MLTELGNIKTDYASDSDDIADEFYNPCLRHSIQYDRITGYFSSSVFHLTWRALSTFVLQNDGKMRLLCSPRLSEKDAEGLLFGYTARNDESLASQLCAELREMLDSPLSDTARLFAALIADGRIDVKLAQVAEKANAQTKRMFHDKVGLFCDSSGNIVGFRGSMNETFLGLSPQGNVESIDVWPSWEGGRDAERVANARARFDRVWSGDIRGVTVVTLPGPVLEEARRIASGSTIEHLFDRVIKEAQKATEASRPPSVGGIQLRSHQLRAASTWQQNGMRGLLSHATGSGKTITGLYCAQQMLAKGLVPVFVVPSTLLLEQWARQVKELLGCRVVLCGAGNTRWSSDGLVRAALEQQNSAIPYAIVTVLNTAVTPAFRGQVRPVARRVGLIADEAHRLGSPNALGVLDWLNASARLGLSATPERANDATGTHSLLDYFGGIVDRYSLADALEDKVLTPYVYEPSWVSLDEQEQQAWDRLTSQIRRLYAMDKRDGGSSEQATRIKMKLIERARIAKGASAKVSAAADIVSTNFRQGQKWLVYCDNQEQLKSMQTALADRGLPAMEYHRQMAGSPDLTLKLFDMNGGVIVAIKCLDEGVDIPSASHALILASSRNPREYIQRRGRVLRKSPGKTFAYVYDVLVLPDTYDSSDPTASLTFAEIARALQFAEWSSSRRSVSRLEQKCVDLGLPLERLDEMRNSGLESDGVDE
ncbi:DEAD/DEAH box helicase family protein [Streptomyces sp. NPDC001811]